MKKIRLFAGDKHRSFAEYGGDFDKTIAHDPHESTTTYDPAEEDDYEDVYSSTPKPSIVSKIKNAFTSKGAHKPKMLHAETKYELKSFLCTVRPSEWICLVFDLLALAFTAPVFSWYLWSVMFAADCAAWICHIYWYKRRFAMTMSIPWQNSTPAAIRCTTAIAIGVYMLKANVAGSEFASLLGTCLWYSVVVTAVYNAFNCIIKTMNRSNPEWLGHKLGSGNDIGLPNRISVSRIACAMLIPHIYVVEPFGSYSSAIATLLLGAAIVTDFLDGKIARSFNMVTRVGKALDPLGDKFIFYPVGVAFLLITHGGILTPMMSKLTPLVIAAALVIVLRDILVILWFFIKGKNLAGGIGASMIDKVRMAAICGWLGGTALSVTVPQTALGNIMAWIGFICLILAAILSVFSLAVDIDRVQKLREKLESAAKSEDSSDTSETTSNADSSAEPTDDPFGGKPIDEMSLEELEAYCSQFAPDPTDEYDLGDYNGPMDHSGTDGSE